MKRITGFLLLTILLMGLSGCKPQIVQRTNPAMTPQTTVKVETTPKDYLQIGFDLLNNEALGPLKLDMTESQLTLAIGKTDTKSKAVVWGSDGMEHSDWTYKKLGLNINMIKEKGSSANAVIYRITASAPCTYATLCGIKIGDTKEAVEAAYKDEINQQESSENIIVIGSVFGGIVVDISNGKVQSILIGASAE
jgi:hypothetical protein